MDHFAYAMRQGSAWGDFSAAYARMSISAAEVIWRRSMQMALGTMTAPEATQMVFEKPVAFAAAAQKAAIAAARGGNPARVATAALRPYGTKTRANARRLAR